MSHNKALDRLSREQLIELLGIYSKNWLAYAEKFAEKGEAMSREWHIKHRLTHKEKLELIANAGQE